MKKIILLIVLYVLLVNSTWGQTIFSLQTEFLGVQKAYSHEGANFVAKNPFLIGLKLHTYRNSKIVKFEWQLNYRTLQNKRYGVLDFFSNSSDFKTVHNIETLFGIRFYQWNNFRVISNKLYCKPTGSIATGISSDFMHIDLETLLSVGICLSAGDYNSGFIFEFVFRPLTRPLLPFRDNKFLFAPNLGFRLGYRFSKI